MSIAKIDEIQNDTISKLNPIKEKQDIFIPDIVDKNIPNRNGFIDLMVGSGGSGKTSLLLNMFKSKNMYRNKFDNIFYICPEASFLSAINHPFKNHDKVFHELNVQLLEEIYQSLKNIKIEKEEKKKKKQEMQKLKNKKGKKIQGFIDIDEQEEYIESEDEDDDNVKYSVVIIDDFADILKDNDIQQQLNKMLIKARHICCAFIFSLQSYFYFPKILRKQITNATIFKPKNVEEFVSIAKELFNMKSNDALTLFNYVFQENYDHLDVDTWCNAYYRNFNLLEIKLKSDSKNII
jgi:hypothetical protein